jgi:cyclin K
LNKFDIVDWQGKPLGYRGKWYEFLVEDVTLELLEGLCFVVLFSSVGVIFYVGTY